MKIHKHAAKAIFRDGNDHVLVLRRSGTHPFVPHTTDLPGGTLDEGEDSFDALLRELLEEINVDISSYSTKLIDSAVVGRFGRKIKADLYEVTGFSDHPEITLSREHDDYEWLPIKDLTHVGSFKSLVDAYIAARS